MIFKRQFLTMLLPGLFMFSFQACNNQPQQNNQDQNATEHEQVVTADQGEEIDKAVCVLYPTEGNEASGTVTFTRDGSSIRIVAELEGLTPGKHGFHIHEYGDCSAPDGTSAGGHFNPGGHDHGGPDDEVRHVGDLGNIEAGDDGTARLEMVDSLMTFSGPNSIIGKGMIVHDGEDDLTSQPTGDAGGRVACGVIGVAE